jgi:hypothetical protein
MKINQSLKIGIFVLIVIGSFLVFPEIGRARCAPACDTSAICGIPNLEQIGECNGGVTPGCRCGCGVRFDDRIFGYCNDTGWLVKSGVSFTTGLDAWTKCDKFPDTDNYNGQPCAAYQSNVWLQCEQNGQGVWDASERKCVKCNGKLENKVCGSAGTVSTDACNADFSYCISLGCAVEGNKKCETACDASVSPKCDDKTPGTPGNPGDPCGNGGHCDENCQCVGEVPPPPPPPPPGTCKTGPTYTCPAAMKCPTCPEELQGGLVPCGRSCDDPCTAECECAPCTLCHLFVLAKRVIDFLTLNILFPLAVLMIVIGGVMFLTAAGDPGRIGTAKKILTSVVIGLVIIFLAWLIVDTIIMFITKSGSPFQNWTTIDCPVP